MDWAARAPWIIVGYFALQLLLRLLISSNLEVDDAEMVGQMDWAWGYARSHPPLFHWLVRLSYDVFGSWAAATAFAKYACLTSAFLLLYDAGRRATGWAVTGALAVAYLFFIPAIAWKTQGKLTHSVLGLAATAATLHALVLIITRPRAWAFAWLGLALSAGILAKYNFLLVIGALAIALLCLPEVRRLFRRRAALVALALPLLLTAPHWLWIRSHPALSVQNLYRLKMGGGPLGMTLSANSTWDGLVSLGLVTLVSLAPMIVIGGGSIVARRGKSRPADPIARMSSPPADNIQRLLGWLLLGELALFITAVFVGGLTQVHERYLVVLLPPFPLWLALRWRAAHERAVAAAICTVALGLAAVITIARPVSIMNDDSRPAFPYAEMAADIAKQVQTPVAILADRPENAANIAIRLPGATICEGAPHAGRVLVIADDPATVSELGQSLQPAYKPVGEVRTLQRPWRWNPNRAASLAVQFWKRADR